MKKKFKKIFILLIVFFLTILSRCELESGQVRLPDLEGLSRAQITRKLDRLRINYMFKVKPMVYHDESQFDKFIEYGSGLKAGDYIDRSYFLYVFTTALPLTVNRLHELTLPDYQGKEFVKDGIGLVQLTRTVDGDTAYFKSGSNTIKVRFLGIDTPEIYSGVEPWGKAASNHTSKRLREAKQIVLEAEGVRIDTYDRYLAFVWVDGVLLNLELVQQAYTGVSLSSRSKYFEIFTDVENEVMKTGRRYWGELDPDYRY